MGIKKFIKMSLSAQITKKRKFINDGIFYAELNELLERELAEDGFAGLEIRQLPVRTEIVIRATRTKEVLGEKGRRIRELTAVVQARWNFTPGSVELFAERVYSRALCAVAQAESVKIKLLGGLTVRRAAYGVVRFVMESEARGCEGIVSGKLRAARAKVMKFSDGYMLHSGHQAQQQVDVAVRHCLMKQGVLGVKVSIMLPADMPGRLPIKNSDAVTILEPKD